MAIKGFERTRTKPQDLREIVQSQGGFLGGLNTDLPKSDVGDTQLPVLKNCLPFRDRVEARGGLKPQTNYPLRNGDNGVLFENNTKNAYYDQDWDVIIYTDASSSVNVSTPYSKDITIVEGGGSDVVYESPIFVKVDDRVILSDNINIGVIEDRGGDYFLRPLTSAPSVTNEFPQIDGGGASNYFYGFTFSFVRKDSDGNLLAESGFYGKHSLTSDTILDNTINEFTVSITVTNNVPLEYYVQDGSDNFYTHIRYYRSELITNPSYKTFGTDIGSDITFYEVGDLNLDDVDSIVVGTVALDLNISDGELRERSSAATLWQEGYEQISATKILDVSAGMLIARDNDRLNEYANCPIGAGEKRKYLGWFNPLLQYGSVNGNITDIQDVGSYCLITTNTRSYFVDTVNYYQDEGQLGKGIFTPILPDKVLSSDTIGVLENQRKALVKVSDGSLIGLTSDGEIRRFSGYQWGSDISSQKVHAITKGNIAQNKLNAYAAFANDAYYLAFQEVSEVYDPGSGFQKLDTTLRLGTTEESGYGFSLFTGASMENPQDFDDLDTALGWPWWSEDSRDGSRFLVIDGKLNVIRKQTNASVINGWNELLEYTGDKFDKKLNKDVIDKYSSAGTPVYRETQYLDIDTEIEFPETTGNSEAYFLYFMKSHFYLRSDKFSYKVANENTKGYEITDDVGTGVGDIAATSLSDVEFGMDVRIGESEDIVASNDNFVPTSAVTLQRDVQDHRIRVTLRADSAGWQLTGMESHFKRHDRTEMEETDTTSSVLALSTGMYCHVNEKLNNLSVSTTRASTFDIGAPIEGAFIAGSQSTIIEGTAITTTTGPDGLQSGLITSSDTVYEWQVPYVATPTKATVMYWENAFTGKVVTGWNRSEINMYEWTGRNTGAWSHTAHVYDGTNWLVYYNGVLQSTTAGTLESYIKSMGIRLYGAGQVADVRMYNKELTASDLLLYVNNITNNEGDYLNGYG